MLNNARAFQKQKQIKRNNIMAIKTQFNAILNKKMDRQNFIKHVAVGIVAVSGAGSALKLLSSSKPKSQDVGYGDSAYGGAKTNEKVS